MQSVKNAFTTGLYRPAQEHDACGVGFVANITGKREFAIVEKATLAVINLTHRGAVSADAKTGDGAGVLTQIPVPLFEKVLESLEIRLDVARDLGVGMVFFPGRDESATERCRTILEAACRHYGLAVIGWREVPVDRSVLGDKAMDEAPQIEQMLIARPAGASPEDFEQKLFLARRRAEEEIWKELPDFYVPSMSALTIVYKGLFVAPQLPGFYKDLTDPDFETALALFHQRYSTNTFPSWSLAQPFRMLAHNGEINTLQGNRNWMRARESEFKLPAFGKGIEDLKPIIWEAGGDSSSLDNALETFVLAGRDLLHAQMMLIPEAWESMPSMDQELRAFYQYHACLTEPWDGPAAVAFTDGVTVAGSLDRNGLRPARYVITNDGLMIMASEVGVLDIDETSIVEKGKLGPGEMIAVDTARGVLLRNEEIKWEVAHRQPYSSWVHHHLVSFAPRVERRSGRVAPPEPPDILTQRLFEYTREENNFIVQPMASEGKEPTFSMGNDTPLAVLSKVPRLIFDYFAQRFAQVTNPPIDPLRESLVMSLDVYLGRRRNILSETDRHAELVHLQSPILLDHELDAICNLENPAFNCGTLDATFPIAAGPAGLSERLDQLNEQAARLVDEGHAILRISDRGVDETRAPIPMLIAVGAIHQHLIRTGRRMRVSLIAETGEARDVHSVACLIGYGASAVNPYLGFGMAVAYVREEEPDGIDEMKALRHYRAALDAGLLKIMSKMGISTLSSYTGAQVFEAVGISQELIDRCFTGTNSPIGGAGIEHFAVAVLERHERAFAEPDATRLGHHGIINYRKSGEYHAFSPAVVKALHKAVREESFEAYEAYSALVADHDPATIRDLLDIDSDRKPMPLDEVEPIEAILERFNTAAMSVGALSPETHQTIAIGMNRIGGKSNTGEGGEDHDWYNILPNGDTANSRIKQVASARFGVTPEYLSRADELQIKMAQGSKPGEGGQLPGFKVAVHIAKIRHAVPGVQLISPPPHHDIYSIEDLAQLIYDLKMVNPRARVNVKLVAGDGVGTIAAGVAKGYADVIHISGHDGGTGASPLSSIKHAGTAWELGLAETQQVLVNNDLRGRVLLTTDGGLKNARDIVVAAMLGAEQYGFGSSALIAVGCKMARQCHLNTCPTGVATQSDALRAKFDGTPDMIVSLFTFMAQEVRMLLAQLGYASLDDLIGRVDLLKQSERAASAANGGVDLSRVLADPDPTRKRPRKRNQERNDRDDVPLGVRIVKDCAEALEHKHKIKLRYPIRNVNRAVGARIAGEVAYRYGDRGLPDGLLDVEFTGVAGQSFGAFCIKGLRLSLIGEANDYVGKGMGGGEIIIRPSEKAGYEASENAIIGNTVLYGATGGALYAAGRGGERFAVRNSGATAVVEGIGDHGCEYMTGGKVVVLGPTGRNFGAGMSNGVAYIYDPEAVFPTRINAEMIGIERVVDGADADALRSLIAKHRKSTVSDTATRILGNWEEDLAHFWKVVPHPAQELLKTKDTQRAGAGTATSTLP